jgi:hypothetical protein
MPLLQFHILSLRFESLKILENQKEIQATLFHYKYIISAGSWCPCPIDISVLRSRSRKEELCGAVVGPEPHQNDAVPQHLRTDCTVQ